MTSDYKHYRMPGWIWLIPPRILNGEDKRFLSFVWWSGFQTCHCHNLWFQRKFHCSRRTVQLRIAKLKKLKLISVGQPNNYLRTLYPRPHKNLMDWFIAMAKLKMIRGPFKARRAPKKSVTEGRKKLRPY